MVPAFGGSHKTEMLWKREKLSGIQSLSPLPCRPSWPQGPAWFFRGPMSSLMQTMSESQYDKGPLQAMPDQELNVVSFVGWTLEGVAPSLPTCQYLFHKELVMQVAKFLTGSHVFWSSRLSVWSGSFLFRAQSFQCASWLPSYRSNSPLL